ncbi:MAG: hypothetical protein ACOVSI_08330 [Gemmatimonas sp.]
MIDRVLPMIEKRGDVDIVYGSKRFGTQAEFATELRALLAERERLAGEVTEWEGHAQTYEAGMVAAQRELAALKAPAPRRLREVTLGALTYRCSDGIVQFRSPNTGEWTMSHSVETEHVRALADLIADPDEPQPVETLESIIKPALIAMYELGWDRHGGSSDMAAEDLAKEIRAWLATQTNTPSDAKNVGAALADSEKQTITPEQAVAVLVEKGAEVFYNDCRDTVFGQSRVKQGVYIVILPKGVTP